MSRLTILEFLSPAAIEQSDLCFPLTEVLS